MKVYLVYRVNDDGVNDETIKVFKNFVDAEVYQSFLYTNTHGVVMWL